MDVNAVDNSLDMELSNIEQWVKMEENGEINEFGLKKILAVYEEKRVPVIDTLVEVNRIYNRIEFQ